MALFKKTVVCAKCGVEFEVGKLSNQKLCTWCSIEDSNEHILSMGPARYAEGYKQYYSDMPKKFKPKNPDIQAALQDRDRIIEKYKFPDPIFGKEISLAASNYDQMSDSERQSFVLRLDRSVMETMTYSTVSSNFILSHVYPGLVIDISDVFAVAFKPNDHNNLNLANSEQAYTVALFTNDPFVPAYSLTLIIGKTSKLLSLKSESKCKEEALIDMLSFMFKDIAYPITTIKEFKKLIKNEGAPKADIQPDLINALIDQANAQQGIFAGWLTSDAGLDPCMNVLMQRNGYMSENYINETLQTLFPRDAVNFWRPYFMNFPSLSQYIEL